MSKKHKTTKTKTMKIAESVLDQMAAEQGLTMDSMPNFGPCRTLGYGSGSESPVMLAQDQALDSAGVYDFLHSQVSAGLYSSVPQFLGYGILSNLTQDGLIRAGVEMRADEMTRKWIELTHKGQDDDKEYNKEDDKEEESNKGMEIFLKFINAVGPKKETDNADNEDDEDKLISDIQEQLDKYKVQSVFREATAMSGYFGGCLVYLDMGDITDEELKLPLRLDPDTLQKGSLRKLKIVPPYLIAPGRYDASNPIADNYFDPESWLVMGKEIHRSRFLYFSEGKPPTLLLPAYNFFGIPLSQIVLDVVTHFTECRESEMRLLKKFSLTVLKTDMSALIGGGSDIGDINRRVQYFIQNRDNDGMMVIDQEREDIIEVTKPLSGVMEIVKQAQELVAAYFGEPAVKLWGLTPGGLNATGEADMQNHYDHIHSIQEKIMREPLARLLDIIQYNLNGEIDQTLSFDFVPLGGDDEQADAQIQQMKAGTMVQLMQAGVIDGEEARKALAEDPKSMFTNIDPGKEIEQPGAEGMEGPEGGAGGNPLAAMMQGGGAPEQETPETPKMPQPEKNDKDIEETKEEPKKAEKEPKPGQFLA